MNTEKYVKHILKHEWYTVDMLYAIGTHVDLDYLNRKAPVLPSKSEAETGAEEGSPTLYEVGTQFIYDFTQKRLARRIQVVFA